jgi:SAM-dependent methyltransferase
MLGRKMNLPISPEAYTGTDNLEAMAEAKRYNQFLVGLITSRLNKTYSVVDFGAGIGTFAVAIEKSCANLVCVEPDVKQISLIMSKNLQVVSDITSIESETIDFLYSLNVLEHIENDEAAVREVARVLKPNAIALIYVPAKNILFSAMDYKVGHYRRYSKKSLRTLVTSANFEITRLEYVDCIGFFATLAYKIFGNANGDLSVSAVKFYDRYLFPISRLLDKITHPVIGKNLIVEIRRA